MIDDGLRETYIILFKFFLEYLIFFSDQKNNYFNFGSGKIERLSGLKAH